jgi:hypothetical protein
MQTETAHGQQILFEAELLITWLAGLYSVWAHHLRLADCAKLNVATASTNQHLCPPAAPSPAVQHAQQRQAVHVPCIHCLNLALVRVELALILRWSGY